MKYPKIRQQMQQQIQDIPKICQRYALAVPKICQYMPRTCIIHEKYIYPKYIPDIIQICTLYVPDIFQKCPKCIQEMSPSQSQRKIKLHGYFLRLRLPLLCKHKPRLKMDQFRVTKDCHHNKKYNFLYNNNFNCLTFL